jgi:hypothetical protein
MRHALALVFVLTAAAACGSKSNPLPPGPPQAAPCVKGGCSGQLCEEEGAGGMTTCEFRAEYACYREATCERQPDGACGWTPTDTLTACLASPPPLEGQAAEFPIAPQ